MNDTLISRLASFGYNVNNDGDTWLINFVLDKVQNLVKDTCCITEIPNSLTSAVVDLAAAEFLEQKKTFSLSDLDCIDLQTAIKSVQEGDVTVTYAVDAGSLTQERRLDLFIEMLKNSGREAFNAHRCIVW